MSAADLAEVKPDVKFFLEKIGAAIGIAQIFRGIATRFYLQADGATLKRSVNVGDALAMRMIEPFGNAQDGGQAARHALIQIGE